MEELIVRLIDLVENTAPELWRIGLRQVLAVSIQSAIGIVFSVIIAYVCIRIAIWGKKNMPDDYAEDEMWQVFAMVFGLVVGVVAIVIAITTMINLISYVINPEYYAIQYLLNLAR